MSTPATSHTTFSNAKNKGIPGISLNVKHLFEKNVDADIVLRSSDHVDFRTFQSILFLGSPVLRSLIQQQLSLIHKDIQEDNTNDHDLPVVHLTEDSDTVEALLLFSYPRWAPVPSLNTRIKVEKILEAVLKYKMDDVLKLLEEELVLSPLLDDEPKRLFAIACHYKLDKLVKLAARRSLAHPFFDKSIERAMRDMNAGALYRIHAFFFECKKATCALATNLDWIPTSYNFFTWFSCRKCMSSRSSGTTSTSKTRKWWTVYMAQVAASLIGSSQVGTSISPELVNRASRAAETCSRCKERAVSDMTIFSKLFTSEAERVITDVSQRPIVVHIAVNYVFKISDRIFTQSEEMTINAPAITITRSPFNDHRADVTIRTSDNCNFRVHKVILSLASPVFSSMFDLPPPPDTVNEQWDLPVVPVSENSRTMEKFLQFCYPLGDPVLDSLQDVGDILEVMRKYDVEEGQKRVRKYLSTAAFLERRPLQVFAIAYQHHLEEEVQLAASYTLRRPRIDDYCAELERLPASAYFRLAKYNSKCRVAITRVVTPPNIHWIPDEYSVLFRCKQCLPIDSISVLIADGKTGVYPPQWWLDYMLGVSAALEDAPYFEMPSIENAVKAASACSTCRVDIHSRMKGFSQLLAAEVHKVIAEVRQLSTSLHVLT